MKKRHRHMYDDPPTEPVTADEPTPDIDTTTEVSDTPPAMSGQTFYNTYVSLRHAQFNDGGSYLPWAHMQESERQVWSDAVNQFLNPPQKEEETQPEKE